MYHLFFVQKKNKVNKKRKLITSQKCKYSTFNKITDNFSSLDNNFLKLSSSEQPSISKSSNSDSISISTSANKSIPQNVTVSSGKIKCCLLSSTRV